MAVCQIRHPAQAVIPESVVDGDARFPPQLLTCTRPKTDGIVQASFETTIFHMWTDSMPEPQHHQVAQERIADSSDVDIETLKLFIEDLGGIENARRVVDVLEELLREAA